jgi:hypothetical protein
MQVFLLFLLPKGRIFDLRRYNSAQTHTDIDSAYTDIDSARIDIDSARIDIDSARIDIDSARIDIDSARIDDSFLMRNMDLSEAGERKVKAGSKWSRECKRST